MEILIDISKPLVKKKKKNQQLTFFAVATSAVLKIVYYVSHNRELEIKKNLKQVSSAKCYCVSHLTQSCYQMKLLTFLTELLKQEVG